MQTRKVVGNVTS